MFERFSDEARWLVVTAQAEAKGLGQNYIGPEHLLLALFQETEDRLIPDLAGRELPLAKFRSALIRLAGPAPPQEEATGTFTLKARHVLEDSATVASETGHYAVLPEHLLLALLRHSSEPWVAPLVAAGLDVDGLKKEIARDLPPSDLGPGGPGPRCSKCGASFEAHGKVKPLTLTIEDGRVINIKTYYCGRCGTTYGLVKHQEDESSAGKQD